MVFLVLASLTCRWRNRQNQLNELKTQLYESKAKEQKLQSLGLQWKQKCKALDEEFQKAKALIVASQNAKDVARMQKELAEAKQAIEGLKKSSAAVAAAAAAGAAGSAPAASAESGNGAPPANATAAVAAANEENAAVIEGLRAELQKEKELVAQAKELLSKSMEKKKQEAAKQMEELQNVQQERGLLVVKLEAAKKEIAQAKEAANAQMEAAKEAAKKAMAAAQSEGAQTKKELADVRTQVAALQRSQTADVNVLRETVKKQNAQVAKAEEEAEAFKAQAREVQAQLSVANEREKAVAAQLERAKLDLERLTDQLKFASDDKQQILAEKRKQFERLEVEKSEQLASLENKLTELASRLKGKHAALTEAVAERDELRAQAAGTAGQLSSAAAERDRLAAEKAQLQEEARQLREQHEQGGEALRKAAAEWGERRAELESRVKELEQQIVDLGLERRVSEKKSVQLIKDLQSQLAKLQGSQTPTTQRANAAGRKGSQVALHSGNAAAAASAAVGGAAEPARTGSPMRVDLNLLQEENNSLIHRITEMQQAKWKLEERIKDLEMLNRTLCEDVAQKTNIIRAYVMEVKSGGRRDMARELHKQNSTVGIDRGAVAGVSQAQMLAKFEEVLEDALLKNMQLKNDLEVLGNEVEELRLKNQDLQKLLGRD